MKKFVFNLSIIGILSILFSSCIFLNPPVKGNGNVVEEERDVSDFNRIKATKGVNVYITQGNKEELFIKADENLIDYIDTRIEKGVLIITTKRQFRNVTSNKVFVTVDELNKIVAFAGSNIYAEEGIRSNDLILSASAGSNMKLKVSADVMDVNASAGANIYLEGTSQNLKVGASAGSTIKAEELVSKICEAKVSSGATIFISVENELDGNANSGGNVYYYGNPGQLNISSSSGGNVSRR